ncbi:MAG: histidinol-phosphate transaminase, partial [Candidatus Sedimenticola sp. (ex Thyasira tokunagai)]
PDSVVVVDEAYIDFGGDSAATLVSRYPNLLVIQTLSKSRSLAGLRVGFAIGDEALIEGLERVKNSFNSYPLDRFAIAGGAIAMDDRDYFNQCRKKIINSREALAERLNSLGFQVLPSAANFLFVRHPEQDAETLAFKLREKGIIVRYFKKPRIDQFLRITVGTEEECGKLYSALEEVLG